MTGPHTPRSIVVSMGDPAGIGPELALQAWQHERASLPPFALLADGAHLAGLARRIGLADLPLQPVESPDQVNRTFATALPVLTCPLARPATPGTPDPANGAAVVEAIRRGAAYCLSGEARALVTLPIHKKTLYDAGFGFP
ncbi:MAG: 4-hydroxythreonine-4-phosphate dehydrogenase PdxA, partial [Alphaproteobacteria bacterium]